MRKLQPRIEQLKERYGDDRQRMSQAMMELYKKEKVNPLGGCLPILVQIPIFISLYWVLLESVELRQAPFILWIDNLSVRDPFFILPAAERGVHVRHTKADADGWYGPTAAENDDHDADCILNHVRIFPGRPGSVLGHQRRTVAGAAVLHHAQNSGCRLI